MECIRIHQVAGVHSVHGHLQHCQRSHYFYIVLFPDVNSWKQMSAYCIETTERAAIGYQDAKMVEILVMWLDFKLSSVTTATWMDCMALLQAARDSWRT